MSTVAAPATGVRARIRPHLAAALRSGAYLLAGLPLGLVHLIALAEAAVTSSDALRRPLAVERTLLNRLLAARLPPPPERLPRRALLALAARLPLALLGIVAAAAPVALAAFVVVESGRSLAAGGDRYLGPWALDGSGAAVALLLVVPAAILFVAALEAYGAASRAVACRALATVVTGGAVREALAESLGDRTLTIAYWLPDRELFVDEHGHPVEMPQPESGRSWTAIENGGHRVAAIVHDAELEARPELVQAAAAGAVLALENEQLKADLRARLQELQLSRKRIVQASVDARRQLERDLHDGAQQQLVSLSLDLQQLKARVDDRETVALLDSTRDKVAATLADLRELARGIHPAILTDRGLEPALEPLVARVPVPVELEVHLDRRPAADIEAAAYFLVAEALTNATKHAAATQMRVSLRQHHGMLEVEVADDGVGGADPSRGSGLHGLEDRVGAVDGTLTIDSPRGRGTRLTALIPCEEETP